ncbi:MAG: hypothetical protein R3C68_01175 [Myxococcota bacterium]
MKLPAWLSGLLLRRGICGAQEVEHYLKPSLTRLDDPMSMADMGLATQDMAGDYS